MVIYMDDYRKAQAAGAAGQGRYDDEVLCVNWNPAVTGLSATRRQTTGEPAPALPGDGASLDVEAFLTRVYALATQV